MDYDHRYVNNNSQNDLVQFCLVFVIDLLTTSLIKINTTYMYMYKLLCKILKYTNL